MQSGRRRGRRPELLRKREEGFNYGYREVCRRGICFLASVAGGLTIGDMQVRPVGPSTAFDTV